MFEHFDVLILLLGAVAVTAAVVFFLASRTAPTEERRRSPRIEAPPDCAVVSVNGVSYALKNWSATGFLAAPYDGNVAVGQKCIVNIRVRQEHFDIAFAAEALVVRRGAGELAGRFVFLSPNDKGKIEAYFAYHAQMR
jgi:hypothetical protein